MLGTGNLVHGFSRGSSVVDATKLQYQSFAHNPGAPTSTLERLCYDSVLFEELIPMNSSIA